MPSDQRKLEVGFPIRKSRDQSLFAAPPSLSQRTTSFIASQRQGIHRILLRHLIALIIDIPRRTHSAFVQPRRKLNRTCDGPDVATRSRTPLGRGAPQTPRQLVQADTARISIPDRPLARSARKDQLLQTYPRAPRSSRAHKTENADPATRDRHPRRTRKLDANVTSRVSRRENRICSLFTMSIDPAHRRTIRRRNREAVAPTRDVSPGKPLSGRPPARQAPAIPHHPNPKVAPPKVAHHAMVEPDGIEPTTSCLQSTRSPN